MLPNSRPRTSSVPLLLLLALLSACAHDSPLRRPPAAPEVPPLPAAARQPERPPICRPTCSDGLTRLYEELLGTLTPPGAPASSAPPATTR